MTRGLLTLLLALACHAPATAQTNGGTGASLPSTCTMGSIFVLTSASPALEVCTATDTWTAVGWSGGSGVPTGAIVFVNTGTCPTGYTEVAGLSGKMLRGTVAANADVGATGGSDSVTPTFTGTAWSAPAIAWPAGVPTHSGTTASFTGSALATHAHELPWQIPSTTTIRQIAVATFGTGTSRAATAVSAAGTANTTSAAVALSQAVSAGTPAGSVTITSQGAVAWPVGVPTIGSFTPAGTISAVDTRAAYIKLIGCSKT